MAYGGFSFRSGWLDIYTELADAMVVDAEVEVPGTVSP